MVCFVSDFILFLNLLRRHFPGKNASWRFIIGNRTFAKQEDLQKRKQRNLSSLSIIGRDLEQFGQDAEEGGEHEGRGRQVAQGREGQARAREKGERKRGCPLERR
jgi:hypothetical protein